MESVSLEFFKLRRKHLFLMITLLLSVEIAWAFMSVSMYLTRNPGKVGWADTIVTIASMNGLFLPIILAVVVSRICDMEHKGNTWKLLMTASVRRSQVYTAKYICACFLLLYAVALQVAAIAGFGIANTFGTPIPLWLLIKFSGGTMLTSMAVIALQQWVSLAVKNQAFALSLGMLGGFIGMTADLFPATIRRIFIWSYYTGLSPVTYSYANNSMKFIANDIEVYLPIAVLLMGITAYFLGNIHVSRQDV